MKYIIAYDIADPKRLRKIARLMEKWAIRTQKSVFLHSGDSASI
ncbi:MAG: CRISPR-associated endonuclease Cas2 [Zavarzinella sp.]